MRSRNPRRRHFQVETLENRTVLNASTLAQDLTTLVKDISALTNDLNAKTPPSADALTKELATVKSDFATLLGDVPKGEFQGLVTQLQKEVTAFTTDANTLITDLKNNAAPATISNDLKAVNADTGPLLKDAGKLANNVAEEESDKTDDRNDHRTDDRNDHRTDDRGDRNDDRTDRGDRNDDRGDRNDHRD